MNMEWKWWILKLVFVSVQSGWYAPNMYCPTRTGSVSDYPCSYACSRNWLLLNIVADVAKPLVLLPCLFSLQLLLCNPPMQAYVVSCTDLVAAACVRTLRIRVWPQPISAVLEPDELLFELCRWFLFACFARFKNRLLYRLSMEFVMPDCQNKVNGKFDVYMWI